MKAVLSALVLLTLAACGFSPMYGSGAGHAGVSTTDGFDKIEIAMIEDESGVRVRNVLIDHFYRNGYPSAPAYLLEVTKIREDENDLDITIESEATRKQIKLTADIALKDKASGAVLLERRLTSLTSYNVLGSQFTTRVSENDAREAALNDLARQIENQVALYFKK